MEDIASRPHNRDHLEFQDATPVAQTLLIDEPVLDLSPASAEDFLLWTETEDPFSEVASVEDGVGIREESPSWLFDANSTVYSEHHPVSHHGVVVEDVPDEALPQLGDSPVEESFYEQDYVPFVEELEPVVVVRDIDRTVHPGDSVYYPSCTGLARGAALYHLFTTPVEVLANHKSFTYREGIVSGWGWMMPVPYSPRPSGLPRVQYLAVKAEETLRFFMHMDSDTRPRRTYFRNLDLLKHMRTTFDALMLAHQEVALRLGEYPRSGTLAQIRRFKDKIVLDPYGASTALKKYAADCRAWYFGGPKPQSILGQYLMPQSRRGAFIASYLARALPPPKKDPTLLEKLKERLCGPEPIREEHPDWKPWLRQYLTKFKPDKLNLWSMPSGSAAFGYKRGVGGHAQGVKDLTLLGYALHLNQLEIPQSCWTIIREFNLDELKLVPYGPGRVDEMRRPLGKPIVRFAFEGGQSLDELFSQAKSQEFWRQCLTLGTIYCMEALDCVPVLPIYAEEKGLKVRYPTCTPVAANLVYQILRRALEQHMVLDPRCSRGLGGLLEAKLGSLGPWYSQDMSFATDLHQFWLTRGPYEVLVELWPDELSKYSRWFDKIFGPKKLVTERLPMPDPPFDLTAPGWCERPNKAPTTLVDGGIRLPLVRAGTSVETRKEGTGRRRKKRKEHGFLERQQHADFDGFHSKIRDFIRVFRDWVSRVNALEGTMTRRGGMMGDATSFPPMSLMSMFSADAAGFDPEMGSYTGDDTLLGEAYDGRRRKYEALMDRMGGVISQPKTFVNQRLGLFTEIPYQDGRPMKYTLLSMFNAPPGGSKGEINAFSQPGTIRDHCARQGRSPRNNIWTKVPHRQAHRALFTLGVPIGAPGEFGGLDHPGFPRSAGRRHNMWLQHLSQIKLDRLITGTGLNPIQSTATSTLRNAGREAVRRVLHLNKEEILRKTILAHMDKHFLLADDEYLPSERFSFEEVLTDDPSSRGVIPIDEFLDRAIGPIQSWEFYFRDNLRAKPKVPSILGSARRFHQAISQTKHFVPKRLGTSATLRDLARKKDQYVVNHKRLVPRTDVRRSFGLERSQLPVLSRDSLDRPYTTPSGDLRGSKALKTPFTPFSGE